MKEYKIKITGNYDILILHPKIISNLIKKVKDSDTKEMIIQADEIMPKNYNEYLKRVLQSNASITKSSSGKNMYELIAEELEKLQVNNKQCFDKVSVVNNKILTSFDVDTNETFYMLIKQRDSQFKYVFKNDNGEEITVLLEYQ